MTLRQAEQGREYIVRKLLTEDNEISSFLFSLGCYAGEPVTVISHKWGSSVVSIKDGRYCIDRQLADSIVV